jgi:hypothetical protein
MSISVVINYCTNEHYFLDACIKQCQAFSDDIVVSYGSKLYNGESENQALINESIKKYKNVTFSEYEVDPSIKLSDMPGVVNRPITYWHNLARWSGYQRLKKHSWVMFLDVDEIPDGIKVLEWFKKNDLVAQYVYKLANYWYFKKVNFQALAWEDSVVVINGNYLKESSFFGDAERENLILASDISHILRFNVGLNGLPMMHHFSWVRTREQLLKKLSNWGHQNDYLSASSMVDKIFSSENAYDLGIKNYQYQYVPNFFGLNDSLCGRNVDLLKTNYIFRRNEACPCRQGKKYKDCHGSLTGITNSTIPKSNYDWYYR